MLKKILYLLLLLPQLAFGQEDVKLVFPVGHSNEITKVLYSPNGRFIVSSSNDGTIKVWETSSRRFLYDLPSQSREVNDIAFSKNGKYIAVASTGVFIWDIIEREKVRYLFKKGTNHIGIHNSQKVICVNFSSDGKKLVTVGADTKIRVWDWEKGNLTHCIIAHNQGVQDSYLETKEMIGLLGDVKNSIYADFTPSGDTLISISSSDCNVYLWNLKDVNSFVLDTSSSSRCL